MSFDDDEASTQDSEPREFFEISINSGVTVYRHALGTRDMAVDAVLYTAIASERGEIGVNKSGDGKELTLTLPIDHPLAQRYTQNGVPPKKITLSLWRRQSGGAVERQFVGDITSMSVDDENTLAVFRVPSRAGETQLRVIPNVVLGKKCPHVLGDTMCRLDFAGSSPSGVPHRVTTTVQHVNGREVRVDLVGVTASDDYRETWAVHGQLHHIASGERMTIISQTDQNPGVSTVATLSMQAVIAELKIGDTVEIFVGCDWLIETCHLKFNNRHNFAGAELLPDANPFIPGSTGSEAL